MRKAGQLWGMVRAVLLTLAVATAHWVLMVMSFGAAIAGEVGGPPPWWGALLGRMFVPLGFPATLIIGRWVPSLLELSNTALLVITVGTSLMWGLTVMWLWSWLSSRLGRFRAQAVDSSMPEGAERERA